jgi:hypothetical protein
LDGKRKELQKLLIDLDSRKEEERSLQRQRAIDRNRHPSRFRDLKKEVMVPALRGLMVDLESKGHFTRLTEKSQDQVRLDVQLQARGVRRGAIEFALHGTEPGKLQVGYAWGWSQAQEVYALEQVDPEFVAGRVLRLLQGLVEPPDARP